MHVCTIAKKCTKRAKLIEFHQWWIQGRGLGCGSPHLLVLDQTDCPPACLKVWISHCSLQIFTSNFGNKCVPSQNGMQGRLKLLILLGETT